MGAPVCCHREILAIAGAVSDTLTLTVSACQTLLTLTLTLSDTDTLRHWH